MRDYNNIFLIASIAISAVMATVCGFYCVRRFTKSSAILAFAAFLFLLRPIIAITYYNVNWLEVHTRYVLVFLTLNLAILLLYYLIAERLYLLIRKKHLCWFKIFVKSLLVLFSLASIAQITMFTLLAKYTKSGGYISNGPGILETKVLVHSIDMIIALVITMFTSISVLNIVQNNQYVGASMKMYYVMLTSDAVKFFLVVAINIYKIITTLTDPSGQQGFVQGNLGYQHLMDTIKIALMIISLIAPTLVKKEGAADTIQRSVSAVKMDLERSSLENQQQRQNQHHNHTQNQQQTSHNGLRRRSKSESEISASVGMLHGSMLKLYSYVSTGLRRVSSTSNKKDDTVKGDSVTRKTPSIETTSPSTSTPTLRTSMQNRSAPNLMSLQQNRSAQNLSAINSTRCISQLESSENASQTHTRVRTEIERRHSRLL
ncbi:hypothetical protein HDU79_002045 [Rhizoclosmatium sp. JEL0117]|nr:hypothetical protein HDU79_002045 [Rhizoclosmatium sp. JEL0117]